LGFDLLFGEAAAKVIAFAKGFIEDERMAEGGEELGVQFFSNFQLEIFVVYNHRWK